MRSVKWVAEQGGLGARQEGEKKGKGSWDEVGRKMEGEVKGTERGKGSERKKLIGWVEGGKEEGGGDAGEDAGGYGKWEYYLGRSRIGGGKEPLGTMLITDLWSKSLQKECLEKSNMIKEKKMLEKYLFYKNKKEYDKEEDEEEEGEENWVELKRIQRSGRMFEKKREVGGKEREEKIFMKDKRKIERGKKEEEGGGRFEILSERVDRYVKGNKGFVFTQTLPLNKSLNPERNDMVKKLKDLVKNIENLKNENQKDKK